MSFCNIRPFVQKTKGRFSISNCLAAFPHKDDFFSEFYLKIWTFPFSGRRACDILNKIPCKEAAPLDDKKRWLPNSHHFISNLLLILCGISFYLGLSHLPAVRRVISNVMGIMAPFFAAFVIAYVLNRPTLYFERTVFRRAPGRRALSILLSYLCALAVVAFLLTLVLPQVVQSIMGLANNIETYLGNFNALVQHLMDRFELDGHLLDDMMVSYQDIISDVANFVVARLPQLLDYGMALGSGVINGITALIASIYLLAGKEQLLTQTRKLIYAIIPQKRATWFLSVCSRANSIFSGFIIGKILDSAIIGVLCFILCSILRIPLTLLISVIVGFTNVIPFFGPIVGAVPSIMILLLVDPFAALRFLVLVLALQQFDGNILGPRILGNSTGLSAIWVLVAIVLGGGLFGFAGMILGVPTFAVIYTLTQDWTNRRLEEKQIGMDLIAPPDRAPDDTP